MNETTGQETFESFEKRRWGETAAAYDRHYVALTDQTIDLLLDRACVSGPVDCLDLACGPGTLAARAAARGARVVGVDFAPEMVERALSRHRGATIDFRVGDAHDIALASASMDAVLINFGLMHMARPDRVASEVARVLRPDGRLAFTVWARPEQSIASQVIGEAMALVQSSVPMPAGEPFYRFCDPEENRSLLGSAGMDRDSVVVEEVPLMWHFDDANALFELFRTGTTRSALVLAAQGPETLEAVREAFTRGVSRWATGRGDFAVPHAAVMVTASRAAD